MMDSILRFALTALIIGTAMSVAWDYRVPLRKWFGM